jgi:catechol 2,3-dioxygenase-like lactoylglutathione lyase family enzyme
MPEPGIRALHQVAHRTTDLDRSIAFYRDVLGLRFLARVDPPGLAFFDLGNTRLLIERGEHSAILYLAVPDIEAAHESLTAWGVHFDTPPHLVHHDVDGTFGPAGEEEWMAFLRDPDDNVVAILERRAASS